MFLPLVKRMDLSVSQDIFGIARRPAALRPDPPRHHQLRQPAELGLGRRQRLVQNQILTNAAADAEGRATYRMAVVNSALPTTSFQTTQASPTSTR